MVKVTEIYSDEWGAGAEVDFFGPLTLHMLADKYSWHILPIIYKTPTSCDYGEKI